MKLLRKRIITLRNVNKLKKLRNLGTGNNSARPNLNTHHASTAELVPVPNYLTPLISRGTHKTGDGCMGAIGTGDGCMGAIGKVV